MALRLTGPASEPAPPPEPPPAPVRRPLRDNPGLILFWIAPAGRRPRGHGRARRSLRAALARLPQRGRAVGARGRRPHDPVRRCCSSSRATSSSCSSSAGAGLPFARFRSKLVLALLGMTLVPTLLVLFVGSELIRNSANRWFSAPIDDVLASAREIAADYYQERQAAVATQAARIAADAGRRRPRGRRPRPRARPRRADVTEGRVDLVEIYRVVAGQRRRHGRAGRRRGVASAAAAATPAPAPIAWRCRPSGASAIKPPPEPVGDGGELVRAVAVVRNATGQRRRRRRRQRLPRRRPRAQLAPHRRRVRGLPAAARAASARSRASTCRSS